MEASKIIRGIQDTLSINHVNYQGLIDELGQARLCDERKNGKAFGINDHLRGLILAMLSNNRPWKPIAENLSNIDVIFFDYDPVRVKNTDHGYFVERVRGIKCGNRLIEKQMASLSYNIEILDRLYSTYGSLDNFVTSASPNKIATKISHSQSRYKLKQIGYTLALEYLKNVGIEAFKPDKHVKRLFGSERLSFFEEKDPREDKLISFMQKMSLEVGVNIVYLDKLIWIFCAKDYGEICGSRPKCHQCLLREYCNYPPYIWGFSL
jgi:hypothetical protein